jgi:hypothetical protein
VMGVARINDPDSAHGWYWTTDFGGYVDPSAHLPGKDPTGAEAPEKPVVQPPETDEATDDAAGEATGRGAGGPALDTNALDNGGLGKVGGWGQRARDGADLVLDDGYARLGGYHDGEDALWQKVRIRASATLAYDIKVKAGDRDPDDTMILRLMDGKGNQVAVLERRAGRETPGWERGREDLSRFAGRTLYLRIDVQTDGERLTTFYLDRLALRP